MTTNPKTEYMREYRSRTGGLAPSDRAHLLAKENLAKWVRRELPDVWHDVLAEARKTLGMPTEVGPGGQFTKPIEHGTVGGCRAHRYRKEKPCRACLDAANKYQSDWRRRRSA